MPGSNKLIPVPSSLEKAISSPARKALLKYWGSEDILRQPEILVDLGPEAIIRISRIDRKSLWQIALALNDFGYIDSPQSWLTKGK